MTCHQPRGPRTARARVRLAGLVAALLLPGLAGCSVFGGGDEEQPQAEPTPTAAPSADLGIDSQFTRDGTFQSHIAAPGIDGIDFVYTLYPTKSTPRTNEWYPKGKKYFSFTFQAYDLSRGLRDPFATKRKVYLQTMKVTSRTITVDGGRTEHPYELDAIAAQTTFDPEPVTTRWGMLITSPKGAFELRNQAIGPTSLDTRGVELVFTAVVNVQTSVGSTSFERRVIKQTVPIEIFESDEPTKAVDIPVNAN